MAAALSEVDSFLMESEGLAIKRRRERIGMTLKELADRARVDRGTLAHIEDGTANPRANTLHAILTTLDALEEEMGIGAPTDLDTAIVITVEVPGTPWRVTVKGPPTGVAEAAHLLIQRLEATHPHD